MRSPRGLGRCVARAAIGALWLSLGLGAAEVPDYGQGFAKLLALGLPSVKGATYVHLGGGAADVSGYSANGLRGPGRRRLRLAGNAWLLKENLDGPSEFVAGLGQARHLEIWSQKAYAAHQRATLAADPAAVPAPPVEDDETWGPDQGPKVGSWAPADLDKDIAALLAFLAPPEAPAAGAPAPGDGDDDDDARTEMDDDACGSLFLFAGHCYSAGRTQEANRIVQALFAQGRDRREVLDWALRLLAMAQYAEHLEAFAGSGDWAAWADALDGLEARFRGAWDWAPGVKRIAAEARARAKARPPAITGPGITPEDSALAEALAELRGPKAQQAFLWSSHQLWLLPAQEGMPAETDPISRLKARGPAALPLLVALLEDEYWTPIASLYPGMESFAYSGHSGPYTVADPGAADPAQTAYQSLTRPVSRGQIAVLLLMAAVPLDDQAFAELGQGMMGMPGGMVDPEARKEQLRDLAEAARAWQAEISGKTPVQIAEFYLQKGTDGQQQQAMQYLLEHGGEGAYPALEAAILAGVQKRDSPWGARQLAEQYVMHRGPAAKDFVEKLATQVAAPAPAQAPDAGLFAGAATADGDTWSKEALPRLRRLVTPVAPDQLLAEMQAGRLPLPELWQALATQAQTTPPEELLGSLLKIAIALPDADQRAEIVGYTASARYLAMAARQQRSPGRPPKPEDLPTLDPKAHLDEWRALLADERQGGDPDDPYAAYGNPGPPTIRDLAAMAIEGLYGPQADEAAAEGMALLGTLGARQGELLRARAEARLAGKPEAELPPWPSASHVAPARRDEILQALRTADPATLSELAAKLSPDEILAAGEAVAAEPDLAARLLPVANRVAAVTLEAPATAATAPLEALKDQVLNRDAVRRLHEVCLALGKAGQRFEARLSRAPALGGVVLTLRALPEPKPPKGDPAPGGAETGADDPYTKAMQSVTVLRGVCMASSPTGSVEPGNATWVVASKPAPPPGPAAPTPAPTAAAADRLPDADRDLDAVVREMMEDIDDTGQQEAFWQSVEGLCTDTGSLWSPATISFRCQAGNANGMMY